MSYDREAAVRYAEKWALSRNPDYYNFDWLGGDCTNFVSQCLFAGTGVMNYTPVYGWYYISLQNRTASWTGAQFLNNFLLSNRGEGPKGRVVPRSEIRPGDIVQLREGGRVYHSLFAVEVTETDILVCAHSLDALKRPLASYNRNAQRVYISIE